MDAPVIAFNMIVITPKPNQEDEVEHVSQYGQHNPDTAAKRALAHPVTGATRIVI